MKTQPIATLLGAIVLVFASPALRADDSHNHTHADGHEHAKKEAGPNGGRIIETADSKFEFFVTPEKKVKITFLDEAGKSIEPAEQDIKAIGGERKSPTRLTFTKEGGAFISDKELPEGKEVPMILMVKATPEAKTEVEKFNVNLAKCPTCEFAEYACICAH